MTVKSDLKLLFTGLVTQYPGVGKIFDSLWKEIVDAYSAPFRQYHNLHHLHYIYKKLEECPQKANDTEALTFCLFYHDIVYEIPNAGNEEKSADIAAARMKGLGVPSDRIDVCVRHILATNEHKETDNADTNLFCDADIAILGDTPERYRQYAAKVRDEYKSINDEDYTSGRKKELEKLLSMPRLFKTAYFFESFEKSARKNMTGELRKLSALK